MISTIFSKRFFKTAIQIIALFSLSFCFTGVVLAGTIDATDYKARFLDDDTIISFRATNSNITVTDSAMTGHAWSETAGWINLAPALGGVVNDGAGNLSGYAWGEGAGWVNFDPVNGGVTIDSSGYFHGYAWSQKKGWIVFNCDTDSTCGTLDHKVRTDWTAASSDVCPNISGTQTSVPQGYYLDIVGNCVSTPGGGGGGDVCPNLPGDQGRIPDGYVMIGGNCELVGPDICPNIVGTQTEIPPGLVINEVGACVVPQACELLGSEVRQELDIMIVLDRSGSMVESNKIVQAKAAANIFIDSLDATYDRVGFVSFATQATLLNGLTQSFTSVKNNINAAIASGGTNIGNAIDLANQELVSHGRAGVKQVIIVLTDGFATYPAPSPNNFALGKADIAKSGGAIIYTIGLGSSVDVNLLTTIATLPSYYYHAPTGNDLANIYLEIAAIECTAAPSEVRGLVINDLDQDAHYDNGESGFAGSEISLVSQNGSQPTRTLISSGDGSFIFDSVAPGDYRVCNSEPLNWFQTYPTNHACYSINVIQGIDENGLLFAVAQNLISLNDICPNIDGIQNSVPVGMIVDENGDCIPEENPMDFCPNIDGEQTEVPFGMTIDTEGNCVDLPLIVDLCPNIDGIQDELPADMIFDKNGDCVTSDDDGGEGATTTLPIIPGIVDTLEGIFSGFSLTFPTTTVLTVSKVVGTAGALAAIFNLPFDRIFNSIFVFFSWRRRKPWGTVYDSVTKQPLDPARVLLKDNTGKEIASSITDLDGRYGFLTVKGIYTMLANKTNYIFPSKKLAGKNKDELYSDLYFGEEFKIEKEDEVITKNIPMDPVKFDWNEFAKRDRKLMKFYSKWDKYFAEISDGLYAVGFVTSVYAFLVAPEPYNIIILSLYLIVLVLRQFGFKPRPHGTITEKETGAPLSFAIIRVFSANFPVEIAHSVSDQYGKYYCLIPNGSYKITIEKKNSDESYTPVYTSEVVEVKKGIIKTQFKV